MASGFDAGPEFCVLAFPTWGSWQIKGWLTFVPEDMVQVTVEESQALVTLDQD